MSAKFEGGGGARASAIWSEHSAVCFCIGFDDGRIEVWEVKGNRRLSVVPAPSASHCAVRSIVHYQSHSLPSPSSCLFVGHTNGMVYMYHLFPSTAVKDCGEVAVELAASKRY
jgi:WD40 repeat protein